MTGETKRRPRRGTNNRPVGTVKTFAVSPIGWVRNSRRAVKDDGWGAVISEIHLARGISSSALDGIEKYSHLDVIYAFHRVGKEAPLFLARPRGNPSFPLTGIFAQRKKERPNRLGLSSVRLLSRRGRTIVVRYLDAVDGTPVIDIKPVMREFLPKGRIRQPAWSRAVMARYWKKVR